MTNVCPRCRGEFDGWVKRSINPAARIPVMFDTPTEEGGNHYSCCPWCGLVRGTYKGYKEEVEE